MRWPARIRSAGRTSARGLWLAVVSLFGGIPLFVATVVSIGLIPVGLGVWLTPPMLTALRAYANQQRRWSGEWSGVRIAPDVATPGLRRLTHAATWRSLLWVLLNVPIGFALGLLPAVLLGQGLFGVLVAPFFWLAQGTTHWPVLVAVGVAALAVLLALDPLILTAHARFCAAFLAPGRRELAERVGELSESRAYVVDASAAELRRIERDLHDGAQARLVALGMNIGLAEQMVRTDPDMAVALLAEARASSGQALTELRTLVRGIHPPVLAERGLSGAVRALALAMPLPVDVDVNGGVGPDNKNYLPRVPAPIEAALYFAIAETLANLVKHSGATRASIRLTAVGGRLVVVVRDDGVGGATAGAGGGLAGIRGRLAAFDGTIDVASPTGGPTAITMEVPCGS